MARYGELSKLIKKNRRNRRQHYKRKSSREFEKLFETILPEEEDSDTDYDSADYLDNGIFKRHNHIYFRASVNCESIEKLVKLIDSENEKVEKLEKNKMIKKMELNPLYLHITSFGGSLIACWRAIDAIQTSKIPIYTIVDGHAASAGTLMSIVGKRRFMTQNSLMLIHQLSAWHMGKYEELKDDFENSKSFMNRIFNLYLKHTNMDKEELEEFLKHDKWWPTSVCLEKGLVDDVYGHVDHELLNKQSVEYVSNNNQ